MDTSVTAPIIRPPDVSREGLKFYPRTFFFFSYYINLPRSAAVQSMAIKCIPEVRP